MYNVSIRQCAFKSYSLLNNSLGYYKQNVKVKNKVYGI